MAEDFKVKIEARYKIAKLIQKMEASDDYDKKIALTQVRYIVKDCKDQILAQKEGKEAGIVNSENERG